MVFFIKIFNYTIFKAKLKLYYNNLLNDNIQPQIQKTHKNKNPKCLPSGWAAGQIEG